MRDSARVALPFCLAALFSACSGESDPPTAPLTGGSAALNSARTVQRPLTGSCHTTYEIFDFEFLPPPLQEVPARATVRHAGTCLLSHLGAAKLIKEEVIDFTVVPAHVDGSLELTAANGDQLLGVEASEVQPPDDNGAFGFLGSWRFRGGTGRFQSAEGLAWFTGSGETVNNTTDRT
jgi:hypothetical protein